MKRTSFACVVVTVSMPAGIAFADEAGKGDPPSRPADRAETVEVTAERPPVAVGYQFETGLETTHVSNGIPQYSSKGVPASESLAALKLENLGPGELKLFAAAFVALADPATERPNALDIVPGAAYRAKIGPVEAAVTYAAHLQPRATPVDAAHHVIGNLAVTNRILTPTVDVVGEVVRVRSVYGAFGLQHAFTLGRVTLTPRVSVGVAAANGVDLHANDLTVSLQGNVAVTQNVYVALRPAYSLLLAPASMVKDPSFQGRSTPYAVLALGVTN